MYLHIGQGVMIRHDEILGIFDMDNATLSAVTRSFLSEHERRLMVEIAAVELPKSFILFEENGICKICFSPISPSALKKRMEIEYILRNG